MRSTAADAQRHSILKSDAMPLCAIYEMVLRCLGCAIDDRKVVSIVAPTDIDVPPTVQTEALLRQPDPKKAPLRATDEVACRLRLVHFNDVYILDNLPALKTAIDAERSTGGANNVIVTMGGDFLGPSLLSSLDEGAGMVEMLNLLGVDYVCFGNHEADVSPHDALRRRIRQLSGVWLNSNMPGLEPKLPEHHCRELLGVDGRPSGRAVLYGTFQRNAAPTPWLLLCVSLHGVAASV